MEINKPKKELHTVSFTFFRTTPRNGEDKKKNNNNSEIQRK